MDSRPATYFDDPRAFTDFVHRHGSRRADDQEPYTLYRIVHPKRPGDSALILCGYEDDENAPSPQSAASIEAAISGQRVQWPASPEGATVIDVKHATHLATLVTVRPDPQASDGAPHAIFWIESGEFLENLLTDSLTLGNDRIQFAPFSSGDRTATLVRIEQPSYFLLQRCLEDHPETGIYYPAAEGVYVTWGHRHPLEALWRQPGRDSERGPQWLFFMADTYHAITPPVWEDAYSLTDVVLDFPTETVWLDSEKRPPRFEVPLTLQPVAARRAEPELWHLDEAGVERLETMLQILSEEDLRPFQLCAQKGERGSFVFIREKRAGKQPRHLDLGGTGFASFKGLPNLMLPVDRELLPPLRRDLYKKLFDLKPGILTILIPSRDNGYLVTKLNERGFQPVETLIDYVIRSDHEILEKQIAASVFDFGRFAKAPSRSDLVPREKAQTPSDAPGPLGEEGPEGTATPDQKAEHRSAPSREEPLSIDESKLPALQRREIELERLLATENQTLALWQEMSSSKGQLEKWDEAITAAVDGLWLTTRATEPEAYLRRKALEWSGMATHENSESPAAVCSAAIKQLFHQPDAADLDRWVAESSSFLETNASSLRTKELWLLWGEVLRVNHDARKEAQLRSEIQTRIVEEGLQLNETPGFVRTRIFLDRTSGGSAGDPSGVDAVLANLSSLEQRITRIHADALRMTVNAVLARAYAQVGNTPKVIDLIDHAENPPREMAPWIRLFHAQAIKVSDPQRAAAEFAGLEALLAEGDAEMAQVVDESRALYDQFEEIDNPAAFLSQANRGRLYPKTPSSESKPLFTAMNNLDPAVEAGDEPRSLAIMVEMMNFPDKSHYDDEVLLPQFVESLVRGLSKFRWSDRGAALLPMFESFAERVPSYLTGNYTFYHVLLHTSLADGLAISDLLPEAARHAERAWTLLGQLTSAQLDVIDAGATVISTLEQLPLDQRREGLEYTLEVVAQTFDDPQSHYLSGNPKLFAALIRVLEQTIQASISKDRLSLNHFKNYQSQDEFHILHRIQSERFCS